jgi:hypothetical protein
LKRKPIERIDLQESSSHITTTQNVGSAGLMTDVGAIDDGGYNVLLASVGFRRRRFCASMNRLNSRHMAADTDTERMTQRDSGCIAITSRAELEGTFGERIGQLEQQAAIRYGVTLKCRGKFDGFQRFSGAIMRVN